MKLQRGSSGINTIYLTSALDGVRGQHHSLASLPPGMTRYPLLRKLSGPQGHVERVVVTAAQTNHRIL